LDTAVTVRSRFPDLHMNDEQQRQLKHLEEAVDDAWEPCEQAGIDLINTEPTTLAGIVVAIRYIQIQACNQGAFMPHGIVFESDRGRDGRRWQDQRLARRLPRHNCVRDPCARQRE